MPVTLVLAVAAAGCGGGSTESSEPASETPRQTFTVELSEFKLDPATIEVSEAGTYRLEAVNSGSADHALEVEGGDVEEETETIPPGQSATLTVALEDDTTYELYCPIGGHADQGMKGSVVVGSGSQPADDDDDDDVSGGY